MTVLKIYNSTVILCYLSLTVFNSGTTQKFPFVVSTTIELKNEKNASDTNQKFVIQNIP
jgi:hypothetical protein